MQPRVKLPRQICFSVAKGGIDRWRGFPWMRCLISGAPRVFPEAWVGENGFSVASAVSERFSVRGESITGFGASCRLLDGNFPRLRENSAKFRWKIQRKLSDRGVKMRSLPSAEKLGTPLFFVCLLVLLEFFKVLISIQTKGSWDGIFLNTSGACFELKNCKNL